MAEAHAYGRTGPLCREDDIGDLSDALVAGVLADSHDDLRRVVVLEVAPVSHDRRPRFADDDRTCGERDGRGDHVYPGIEVQDIAAPVLETTQSVHAAGRRVGATAYVVNSILDGSRVVGGSITLGTLGSHADELAGRVGCILWV